MIEGSVVNLRARELSELPQATKEQQACMVTYIAEARTGTVPEQMRQVALREHARWFLGERGGFMFRIGESRTSCD